VPEVATFLLVHGAWHGGWCYRRVENRLRAKGHTAFAPTLTGVGERSHLYRSDIDLDDHVADVLAVIRAERMDDIVLVGHSYGGFVVSMVADRVPDKIRTIVYLDAFVPEEGKCLLDYLPAEMSDALRAQAKDQDGGVTPIPAEVFAVNDADVAWVNSQCVNQPIGTFEQPAKYGGGLDELAGHKVYIWASKFENSPFGQFYSQLRDDPSWKTYAVECGHDIMVDEPDRLAQILEEVAD
jgi:pimeloyl-ACP methyl ester carboxylesterase